MSLIMIFFNQFILLQDKLFFCLKPRKTIHSNLQTKKLEPILVMFVSSQILFAGIVSRWNFCFSVIGSKYIGHQYSTLYQNVITVQDSLCLEGRACGILITIFSPASISPEQTFIVVKFFLGAIDLENIATQITQLYQADFYLKSKKIERKQKNDFAYWNRLRHLLSVFGVSADRKNSLLLLRHYCCTGFGRLKRSWIWWSVCSLPVLMIHSI